MRVALYALGGGHGHALRAFAAARALCETFHGKGCQAPFFMAIVPERLRAWASCPVLCPPPEAVVSREALGAWVRGAMHDFAPDVLVVDVFPRGVLGELTPDLAPRRILLTRWVRPEFYQADGIAQAVQAYDRVLWTERPHPSIACGDVIPPVRWVRPTDLLSRADAREALGVSGHFTMDLRSPGVFPAGAYLRAADLVLSAGGYQSYYEVMQAGVPVRWNPEERRTDDQHLRVSGGISTLPGDGALLVAQAILGMRTCEVSP